MNKKAGLDHLFLIEVNEVSCDSWLLVGWEVLKVNEHECYVKMRPIFSVN